jgi:hypothetical protein
VTKSENAVPRRKSIFHKDDKRIANDSLGTHCATRLRISGTVFARNLSATKLLALALPEGVIVGACIDFPARQR